MPPGACAPIRPLLPPLQAFSMHAVVCRRIGGFKKTFWVLVMMVMAAVLLYNVVELTKKYLSYPISVKLSFDHEPQLVFPAVAICNMSPVKKSSLEAAQRVKRRRKRSAGKSCINKSIHKSIKRSIHRRRIQGTWGHVVPPPQKIGKTFFGQLLCKFRVFWGQTSCKITEFC